MKIKIFTMVKDEVDIVSDWIMYHGSLFGFKNLYIIDNYSADGTYEVLLKFKLSHGIHLSRQMNYDKKGEYMTWYYNNRCHPEDIAYPIDIDEFIVYYDRYKKTISVDRRTIINYIKNLPDAKIYKTNYIQAAPHQDAPHGFERAIAECNWGSYDGNYKENAKSFMKKKLYHGTIDHGNHIPSKEYFITEICLVHFHVRNMDQLKKKTYNNVAGLNYPANNLHKLKQVLQYDPNCIGNHHVVRQISILENTFVLPIQIYNPTSSINLGPLNNFVKQMNPDP